MKIELVEAFGSSITEVILGSYEANCIPSIGDDFQYRDTAYIVKQRQWKFTTANPPKPYVLITLEAKTTPLDDDPLVSIGFFEQHGMLRQTGNIHLSLVPMPGDTYRDRLVERTVLTRRIEGSYAVQVYFL